MINWKLRIQNKITLIAIICQILSLIYVILGMIGIVPSITQDDVKNVIFMVVDLLVMLGIVVDPTTTGITDSARAMSYESPNPDKPEKEVG